MKPVTVIDQWENAGLFRIMNDGTFQEASGERGDGSMIWLPSFKGQIAAQRVTDLKAEAERLRDHLQAADAVNARLIQENQVAQATIARQAAIATQLRAEAEGAKKERDEARANRFAFHKAGEMAQARRELYRGPYGETLSAWLEGRLNAADVTDAAKMRAFDLEAEVLTLRAEDARRRLNPDPFRTAALAIGAITPDTASAVDRLAAKRAGGDVEAVPVIGSCLLCGKPWPHGHSPEQIEGWRKMGGAIGLDNNSIPIGADLSPDKSARAVFRPPLGDAPGSAEMSDPHHFNRHVTCTGLSVARTSAGPVGSLAQDLDLRIERWNSSVSRERQARSDREGIGEEISSYAQALRALGVEVSLAFAEKPEGGSHEQHP